jgi:hypothetical protein
VPPTVYADRIVVAWRIAYMQVPVLGTAIGVTMYNFTFQVGDPAKHNILRSFKYYHAKARPSNSIPSCEMLVCHTNAIPCLLSSAETNVKCHIVAMYCLVGYILEHS